MLEWLADTTEGSDEGPAERLIPFIGKAFGVIIAFVILGVVAYTLLP